MCAIKNLFTLQRNSEKNSYSNKISVKVINFDQNFNKMSIGTKVRKYRMLKGLSQSDLTLRAEISQSVVSSLESDKTIPNSMMLNRIAKVLEVDINELLKDDNIVQNNSDKAIGNIHSQIQNQVTINNNFPKNLLEVLMSNQDKITNLLETQNKLIDTLLKK